MLHVIGIKKSDVSCTFSKCEPCALGKSTRTPRRSKKRQTNDAMQPIERVYSDVMGPTRRPSLGKSKYFVTLLDEFSGYTIVRFLHRKSETASAVTETMREMENLFNGTGWEALLCEPEDSRIV